MFFENFKRICESRGTNPTAEAMRIGKSNSAATNWKKNRTIPKEDELVELAENLGCSVSDFFRSPNQAVAVEYMGDHMSYDGITEFHDRVRTAKGHGSTLMELTPTEQYIISVFRMGGSDWKDGMYRAIDQWKMEKLVEIGGVAALDAEYMGGA